MLPMNATLLTALDSEELRDLFSRIVGPISSLVYGDIQPYLAGFDWRSNTTHRGCYVGLFRGICHWESTAPTFERSLAIARILVGKR